MKISFCTTCMGRLHHLMQTLPNNIISTSNYPNREFVVLNYNSNDQMHSWMINECKEWIKNGTIKYFITKKPKHFIATHAKNIAHKNATGDILCNIDADNYIVEGFSEFVTSLFKENKKIVLASNNYDIFMNVGGCGKIVTTKEDFYNVNGYDEEQYLGWGWEDTSFQFRARMLNNLKYVELDKKWNRVIGHSNIERIKNFQEKDINKSKNFSISRLEKLNQSKSYIVNIDKNWGYVEDLYQYCF